MLLSLLLTAATVSAKLDEQSSSFRFVTEKRVGEAVIGRWEKADGTLHIRNDGQRQVTITLQANSVEVNGSPMQTKLARSDLMFSAQKYPVIEFRSDWHPAGLLRTGGEISGIATMRGVTHNERFQVLPARCERPGVDCDIEVKGEINRERYGLRSLGGMLRPNVELTMKVRFTPVGT